jgi:hypothetical protein
VQYADHAPLDQQRHAEQRLQALLDEDRIEDVGAGDVVDDDRSPLLRDPPGEPAAEWHAHPRLDLLLQPARRAGFELVGPLVEQQDRGGVDRDEAAHAREQLADQVVELEVCERRLTDRLEVAKAGVGRFPGACLHLLSVMANPRYGCTVHLPVGSGASGTGAAR